MFKKIIPIMSIVIVFLLIAQTGSAAPPETWTPGDEEELTGHSFEEEYWTSTINKTTDEGANVSFSMFYINMDGAEAFMVALNNVTKGDETGVIPYQLFGMHYYNSDHKDVFLTAVFAFLMAYNDTNDNGIQDPGNEPVYYLVPFGASNSSVDVEWEPETIVHSVTKESENHYSFGMTYKNLYAKVIDGNSPFGFILSIALPLYTVKFSELSIMYDIEIDNETGEIEVETFYTIGQIELIWEFGWDPVDQDLIREKNRTDILTDQWGISAVHYINIFASNYNIYTDDPTHTVNPNDVTPAPDSINISVGDQNRAFEINYRGTYDLIDEDTNTTISSGLNAMNILLVARPRDLLLVLWQLEFSASVLSTIAYALSPYIQDQYTGPLELYEESLSPIPKGFRRAALWYAVSFPNWEGYRVEHDPVYTAFTDINQESDIPVSPIVGLVLLIAIVMIVAAAVGSVRKKKRNKELELSEKQQINNNQQT